MAHLTKIVEIMQSKQNIEARFMTYDGYLAVLGALMDPQICPFLGMIMAIMYHFRCNYP